jgi:hypothetical protein
MWASLGKNIDFSFSKLSHDTLLSNGYIGKKKRKGIFR